MEAKRLAQPLIFGDTGRAPLTGIRAMNLAEAAHDEGRTTDAVRLVELGQAIFARNVRRLENDAVRLVELGQAFLARNVPRAEIDEADRD